jgi:hypothetical protein
MQSPRVQCQEGSEHAKDPYGLDRCQEVAEVSAKIAWQLTRQSDDVRKYFVQSWQSERPEQQTLHYLRAASEP